MSAFSTSPTRGETSATTSTACLTTAITSSHSPSIVVNIEVVSWGSPEARTTRTAAATASVTDPLGSLDVGEIEKATSMPSRLSVGHEGEVSAGGHPGGWDDPSAGVPTV